MKDNPNRVCALLGVALTVLILVTGCGKSGDKNFGDNTYRISNDPKTFDVIIIDGCEYIYRENNGYQQGPIFTHKGNCKNPIHKQPAP